VVHGPIPPPPDPRWVWQPGYWGSNGVQYVWVPGRYVRPPHRHAVWIAGHWVARPRGWVWVPGHWG
jgi:YXWGXW repeat-containing protein